jgi:hypothetical protein
MSRGIMKNQFRNVDPSTLTRTNIPKMINIPYRMNQETESGKPNQTAEQIS